MRLGRQIAHLLAGLLVATACSMAVAAQTSAELIAKADRLWVEGKLDQAQQAFEAAAKVEPVSTAVLLRLAGFQLSRQDIVQSVQTYRRVIGMEPRNTKAWIGMGLAHLHTSDKELARAAFEEAIRIDPTRKESLKPLLAKLDESKG